MRANLTFGVGLGLVGGLAVGFAEGIAFGLASGLVTGLAAGIVAGLVFGIAGWRYIANSKTTLPASHDASLSSPSPAARRNRQQSNSAQTAKPPRGKAAAWPAEMVQVGDAIWWRAERRGLLRD